MLLFVSLLGLGATIAVGFGAYLVGAAITERRFTVDVSSPGGSGPFRARSREEIKQMTWKEIYVLAPRGMRSMLTGCVASCLMVGLVGVILTLPIAACTGSDDNQQPCECQAPSPRAELPAVSWQRTYALYQFTNIAYESEDIAAAEQQFNQSAQAISMSDLVTAVDQYNKALDSGVNNEFNEPLGEFIDFFTAVVAARNNPADAELLLAAFREYNNWGTQRSCIQALGGIWPVNDLALVEVVQIAISYELESGYSRVRSNIRHAASEVLANWSREHPVEFMAALRRVEAFGLQAESVAAPEPHLFPSLTPIDEPAEVIASPSDETVGN